MAILYVASEAAELKPFAKHLAGLRKLNWPLDYAFEGVLGGRRIILAANGAGPFLAGQVVETAIRATLVADLSSSRLEAVVSTGYCGALDPALQRSAIVVASAIYAPETGERFECGAVHTETPGSSGLILSLNKVAGTAEQKLALQQEEAIAVEMEAAGVAARAKRADLPFSCIKVVTDCSGESFPFELNRMRTPEGRIARGKIIKHALNHPLVLPDLIRLKKCAADASERLGDFLASCRVVTESRFTQSLQS